MTEQTLDRIRQMEAFYGCLLGIDPQTILSDPKLSSMADVLAEYLTGGQWLADYTRDEMGLLPVSLKRSVLSQDGLYDLLQRIDEAK